MKLKTIYELREYLHKLEETLEILERDYLKSLDDDLWTIDLEVTPQWEDYINYTVTFTTEKALTKKYLIRFCEDYGLNLISYNPKEFSYEYVFGMEQEDIIESINKFNL